MITFFLFLSLMFNPPTQTLRGTVVEAVTSVPLTGVTVILVGSEPLLGTMTDTDGRFTLPRVPVGRVTLRFTYVGFEPVMLRDLIVTSGREVVLDVVLHESVMSLGEVVVTPDHRKDQSLNPAALASARLLSIEEASRYAGGFDDPARLALAFAGTAGSLSTNAIVVRGNAPKGLLWRMEGVDIPTPAHFSNLLDFGGGGITALSSHMLADSDFMTGAFPAEYGNALSGVFDLKLRRGNTERFEHTVSVGTIGLDWASEGPLGRGGSFLFNYRYSTFALLKGMLPEDAQKIRYQNLSFHLSHPLSRRSSVSFWGIGANDASGTVAGMDPARWTYDQDREEGDSPTRFGALGMETRHVLANRGTWKLGASATGQGLDLDVHRLDAGLQLNPVHFVSSEVAQISVSTSLEWRWARGFTQKTGLKRTRIRFDQVIREFGAPISDSQGHTDQTQAYTQLRWDRNRWGFSAGVHTMHSDLSGERTFEPRAGIEFREIATRRWSVSYGRHAQTEPLSIRLAHPQNRQLRATQAHHLVLGWKQTLAPDWFMNVEGYLQALNHVPVIADSSFSTVNLELDWFFSHALVNRGAAKNRGVDVTLERTLRQGWYMLASGSLFESTYRGGDGVWRDSRFNRSVVATLLGGKEWLFGTGGRQMAGVNARATWMGGNRISPLDIPASLAAQEAVYDETRAYQRQEPDILYVDLTLQYRINHRRASTSIALQMNNLTGHQDFYGHRYNLRTGRIDEEREALMIPNLKVGVSF